MLKTFLCSRPGEMSGATQNFSLKIFNLKIFEKLFVGIRTMSLLKVRSKHRMAILIFLISITTMFSQYIPDCDDNEPSIPSDPGSTLCTIYENMSITYTIPGTFGGITVSSLGLPLVGGFRVLENKNVDMQGDLIVDVPFKMNNCLFKIDPSVRINVTTASSVSATNCKYFACDGLWQGFQVLSSSTSFFIMKNCFVEDAAYVFEIGSSVQMLISNNRFNRNHVCIANGFNGGIVSKIKPVVLYTNTFTCSQAIEPDMGCSIRATENFNNYSFAGIDFLGLRAGGLIGNSNYINTFEKMYYGVFARASNIDVTNCIFQHSRILSGDDWSGTGVYSDNNSISKVGGKGTASSNTSRPQFENVVHGIVSRNGNLQAHFNDITDFTVNGIAAVDNYNPQIIISIKHNHIESASGEIAIRHHRSIGVAGENTTRNAIDSNIIDVMDPIAIYSECKNEGFEICEIKNNSISFSDQYGSGIFIYPRNSEDYLVADNTLSYPVEQNEGEDKFSWGIAGIGSFIGPHSVEFNEVTGGVDVSYYSFKFCYADFCSNYSDNSAYGFNLSWWQDGTQFNSNIMRDHRVGFLIDPDVLKLDEQYRNANRWVGTYLDNVGARCFLNPDDYPFIVHDSHSEYNPATDPVDWFEFSEGEQEGCVEPTTSNISGWTFPESSYEELSAMERDGIFMKLYRIYKDTVLLDEPEVDDFYNEYQDTDIDILVKTLFELSRLLDTPKNLIEQLAELNQAIVEKIDEVFIPIDTLQTDEEQDTISFDTEIILDYLHEIDSLTEEFDSLYNVYRDSVITNITTMRSALISQDFSAEYDNNLKTVILYLMDEWLDQEPPGWTSEMQEIAELCPTEGGIPTDYARSYLPSCDTNHIRFINYPCVSSLVANLEPEVSKGKNKSFPIDESIISITVYDLLGRLLHKFDGNYSDELTKLRKGRQSVYILQLQKKTGELVTFKYF